MVTSCSAASSFDKRCLLWQGPHIPAVTTSTLPLVCCTSPSTCTAPSSETTSTHSTQANVSQRRRIPLPHARFRPLFPSSQLSHVSKSPEPLAKAETPSQTRPRPERHLETQQTSLSRRTSRSCHPGLLFHRAAGHNRLAYQAAHFTIKLPKPAVRETNYECEFAAFDRALVPTAEDFAVE